MGTNHQTGSGTEPPSPQPPAPDTQGEAKPEYDVGGLKAQIDHMRQQQAAQQQPPQPQQQAQQVDGLAIYLASLGLSPSKFIFLYSYFSAHPDRLNAQHWETLKGAHHIARQERNIPEDSPEYFGFLHSLLNQHAAPPAPPMPPPIPQPAPPPTHVDLEKVESPEGEPESTHMSAMFSAPVSRGEAGHAVEPEPTQSSIRLTAEQRDIAQRSGISEVEYAKQLLRMQRMQKSGLIK